MLKKFRIGKLVLACTLIMALLIPIVGFADGTTEINEPSDKASMFNKNIERPIVNPDRENVERFLGVVKKYSPETLSDWESLAEERKNIIEDIHNVKEDIRELRNQNMEKRKENRREFGEKIRENHKNIRDEFAQELVEKIKSGEITREEAREQLKNYVENNKNIAEGKRDEFKDRIEEWKTEKRLKLEEWKTDHQNEIDRIKAKREEVLGLRDELKASVEADDAEAVKEILSRLYPEIELSNEFLAKKLEWIKEKYNHISTMEEVVISDEL